MIFLGILKTMLTDSFVVHLFILRNILSTMNILSNMFQDKTATLGMAANLVKSVIQTFENSRSSLGFNNLWLEIQKFAEEHGIEVNVYNKQKVNI